MTDGALASPSTYAQVRVREPMGDRIFGETLTVGGPGFDAAPSADLIVPGTKPGPVLQIERGKGVWAVCPLTDARVRFDGQLLVGSRDLRRHDVLAIGDAQLIVTDVSRTLLRLEVCHLIGNATISPTGTVSSIQHIEGDEDLLIQPPRATAAEAAPPDPPRGRGFWIRLATAVVAAMMLAIVISQLNYVVLDIQPEDASVRTPGTLISPHAGSTLWLLPGNHTIRAEHDGYMPGQLNIAVKKGVPASVRLRLAKLPGMLRIDTASVAAIVIIDGVETGRAPGAISMAAGTHTVTLRAPRHVDYIASVDIQGAGASQDLEAVLQLSWGTLQITAIPSGARVAVDGVESGVTPVVVDAPSGVRRVRISAPGLKTWESSVVLKAGEALNVGPITLGQSDAQLMLTSVPSGAEVTVGGTHRGRTPLEVELPAGFQHDLVVNLPGYATWTQSVFADPAHKIALTARLEAVGARVTIQGEPDGAQLFIDGADRGHTPQSLELSATEHHIEVRKEGWTPYTGTVTPSKGLDRTLHYRLKLQDYSIALSQIASTVYTQTGYRLRLVSAGAFSMGNERRARRVTLKRSLYFGVTEVTNEQFRRFRPDHPAALPARQALDPGPQPVTAVSWNEAAEYCNWLSGRDNLPVAYENRKGDYSLKQPVGIGYRLPTDAEWEYAARQAPELGLAARDGADSASTTIGFRVVRYAE
jgi:hypothetical protein